VILAPGGTALLEIGADLETAITDAVAELEGWSCVVEADLAGLPRVAVIVGPAGGPAAGWEA
jgi:hypothetical protein